MSNTLQTVLAFGALAAEVGGVFYYLVKDDCRELFSNQNEPLRGPQIVPKAPTSAQANGPA